MEEFKKLKTKLLALTKKLKVCIENNETDKLDPLLEERFGMIEQLKDFKESIPEEIFEELIKEINSIDAHNFEQLQNIKTKLGKEIFIITKNAKAVSAYRTKRIQSTNMVNETDI